MGIAFWIRRFGTALLCAFVVIALGQVVLRGRPLDVAVTHALSWSVMTASIYVATLLYRLRQGQACALCRDAPLE